MFQRHGVPYWDVTDCSIEEMASRILDHMRLDRHART
jgi:regulator of PEP synthase PpsR (kinase-PPPase family)